MLKVAFFCSASIAVLCAGNASLAAGMPVAFSAHSLSEVHRAISASPGRVTLYDQNNDDNGVAILSSNFTDGQFTDYSSSGADDFTIPAGHKWKIREVDASGEFLGSGSATSENVVFYKDKNGLPGDVVAECDALQGGENQGAFAIKIPKTCKAVLKGGKTYWVSVVVTVGEHCDGICQWNWETRDVQNGSPAAWENPNNGTGTGCTTWEVMTSCVGAGEGPDFMFALKGKDVTLQ
jgi:hypothetical protein